MESTTDTSALQFSELYPRHRAFIACSVRKLGVPTEAVDDAVPDTFLVAYRRLPELRLPASVRTWLFAIALRVVRDHRRSHRRRMRLRERAHEVAAAGPASSAESTERRHALRRALAALTHEHRTVLVLADVAGMTVPEISGLLDANLSTVYTRLRTARTRLAQHWREPGPTH